MYKKPFFLNAAHAQSVRQDGITDKVLFLSCLSVKISRNYPSASGGKSRQKSSKMSEICLPTRPKSVRAVSKVDKNRAKCLNLFYHPPKKICTKKPQLPRCDFSKLFTFPPSRRQSGRLRHECSRPAGSPKTASILPLLQVWPNGQLAFLLQLAGPCEHLLQNRRRSSAC